MNFLQKSLCMSKNYDQALRNPDIVKATREFSETLGRLADAEIKSKDRVDISLAEYEQLKSENSRLKYDNSRLKELLDKIKVPLDKPIINDEIVSCYMKDPMHFRTRFRIEFEVDDMYLKD